MLTELPNIQATLPDGMTIQNVYNATETISASIDEVFKTIAEAVAIVVVVILLFLGSFRSVLMPVVTIPLSLIGVCFFLFVAGYSINLLSLLAMVLAIGLVVDDAIVVVENIHRHIEEGMTRCRRPSRAWPRSPVRWCDDHHARRRLRAADVHRGLTGSLFREFAFTLAGAVIISGLVALTITPMMSARILKAGNHSRFQKFVDRTFTRSRTATSAGSRLAEIPSRDDHGRRGAGGATGFMFVKTTSELRRKRTPARCSRSSTRRATPRPPIRSSMSTSCAT